MKYVIIVDSMSNMPSHVLKTRENIKVIPLNTKIRDDVAVDVLDSEQLNLFYKKNSLNDVAEADATSPTPEQMSIFLLNEVALHYDCAIFQSTSAVLSDVFLNINKCAGSIEHEARIVRKMAGITEPFKLIVSNSGNSSSGQTLLALYTDALLSKGVDPDTAVENADLFKEKIKTYSVISDVLKARNRMKYAGHKTISMPTAVSNQLQRNAPLVSLCNDVHQINHLKFSYKQAIKSLFDYAEQCLESGLHLPIIYISYAGMLKDLKVMNEFQVLQKQAKKHGVVMISGMMSISACINYSAGSISLGIVPKDSNLQPV